MAASWWTSPWAAPCQHSYPERKLQGLAALFQTGRPGRGAVLGQSESLGCELGVLVRGACSKLGGGSLTLGVLSRPEPLSICHSG